jgi:hypothetical protein
MRSRDWRCDRNIFRKVHADVNVSIDDSNLALTLMMGRQRKLIALNSTTTTFNNNQVVLKIVARLVVGRKFAIL